MLQFPPLLTWVNALRAHQLRVAAWLQAVQCQPLWHDLPSATQGRLKEYALRGPMTWGPLLEQVSGKPLSAETWQALLLASVATPLFDDLFDQQGEAHRAIYLLNDPLARPTDAQEAFLLDVYHQLIPLLARKETFHTQLQKVLHSQDAALEQRDPNIKTETIARLTSEKGAAASLLFLEIATSQNDDLLLLGHAFGGLLQLVDDLFDIATDRREGTHTLFTQAMTPQDMQGILDAQWHMILQEWQALPSWIAARHRAFAHLKLFYLFGCLAIWRCKQLAGGVHQTFNPEGFSAREMALPAPMISLWKLWQLWWKTSR